MNEDQLINQTQFAFEEPIYQNQNVELPEEEKPVESEKPKSKKKLFIIIGIVVFFVLTLLIILVIASRGNGADEKVVFDRPDEVLKELSPIMIRIEKARVELEEADPTKQDLVFPPVDMKLRLDPKPKR